MPSLRYLDPRTGVRRLVAADVYSDISVIALPNCRDITHLTARPLAAGIVRLTPFGGDAVNNRRVSGRNSRCASSSVTIDTALLSSAVPIRMTIFSYMPATVSDRLCDPLAGNGP